MLTQPAWQAVHQAWVARQYATMAELLTKLRAAIANLPADKRANAEAVAAGVRPWQNAHRCNSHTCRVSHQGL